MTGAIFRSSLKLEDKLQYVSIFQKEHSSMVVDLCTFSIHEQIRSKLFVVE